MFGSDHSQAEPSHWVLFFKILLILAIIAALNLGGSWFAQQVNIQVFPRHEPILNFIVLAAVALYILLMVIPFMPGIEVGLALMISLGGKGALLVYLCTLVALSISFIIGRAFPAHLVCSLLDWLHLKKASALVRKLEPLDRQERLELLNKKTPAKIAPYILKHRYLAIAAALNLPGNSLIGGGGGIGLVVGMSRIVLFRSFIAVVAIAIAPVPLWFFFYGS